MAVRSDLIVPPTAIVAAAPTTLVVSPSGYTDLIKCWTVAQGGAASIVVNFGMSGPSHPVITYMRLTVPPGGSNIFTCLHVLDDEWTTIVAQVVTAGAAVVSGFGSRLFGVAP